MKGWEGVEPLSGRLRADQWLSISKRKPLSVWWKEGHKKLNRRSIGAPTWGEYVSEDGAVWSRTGLFREWLLRAELVVGKAVVEKVLLDDFDAVISRFDRWLREQIDNRQLVRLIDLDDTAPSVYPV